MAGEVTLGNFGVPTPHVDVDLYHPITYPFIRYCVIYKKNHENLSFISIDNDAKWYTWDTYGGANWPSGKCLTCYCGRQSNVDVSEWCAKYNWNQNCCKCIILHETGGNANAMNYSNNGSTYIGLYWSFSD